MEKFFRLAGLIVGKLKKGNRIQVIGKIVGLAAVILLIVIVAVAQRQHNPAAADFARCNVNDTQNIAQFERALQIMRSPGTTPRTASNLQGRVVQLCLDGVSERNAFKTVMIPICPAC
jgi:hypothetical protein